MNSKTLLLIGLFSICGFSAQNSSARTIAWKEAVQLAEKNNLELQSALAVYNSVTSLDAAAASGFMPHLSATARGTHSGAPSAASQFSYSAGLSLTQNLFAGFSDIYSYKLKATNSEQAKIDYDIVRARISQELKQIYAEAYYAQVNKKLTASILKRREENFRSVQLQYEIGRENKGSLLLSQSYVEQARYDVLRSENETDISLENFRRYLGLEATENIELENNIEKESISVSAPDFNKMTREHSILKKSENEERIAQYNLNVSRAEFMPSLDFNAGYNYSDTKFFPENDTWSMGLTLSIPLFDGFSNYARYNSISFKRQAAELGTRSTQMILMRDLKRAYYDYIEALQKEKVDIGFNQAALLRADIARNKYKNGLLSFEDWDTIESDLIQKQKEILLSEKNRVIKQSQWEKAQVTGVFQ